MDNRLSYLKKRLNQVVIFLGKNISKIPLFTLNLILLLLFLSIGTLVLSAKAIIQQSKIVYAKSPSNTSPEPSIMISPVAELNVQDVLNNSNTTSQTITPTPSVVLGSSTSGNAPITPTAVPQAGSANPTATPTPTSITLPPQGVYESCSPSNGQTCLDRLTTIAAGGFKYVVNYSQLNGSPADEITYLNKAQSLGMQVILAVNNAAFWNGTNLLTIYSQLASSCGCSDNTGFTQYVVNLVKGNSGLWGYYVGDEIATSQHTQWKTFVDLVKQTDATHPRLIVLGSNGPSVNTDLQTFADGADTLAQDYYPIGYFSNYTIDGTGTIAQGLQALSRQYNKQMAMVLQSQSWQQYFPPARCSPYPSCAPYPAEAQMRQMRDLVLNNSSPQLLLWYSYFDTLTSDNPTLRWNNIVAAAGAN